MPKLDLAALERLQKLRERALNPAPGITGTFTGGLRTCDGNCHKPIEQGGAAPCDCPCCQLYA